MLQLNLIYCRCLQFWEIIGFCVSEAPIFQLYKHCSYIKKNCKQGQQTPLLISVFSYFCNLFGLFIQTCMQNLKSVAQKMSELPVTNLHIAVSVSDQRFFFKLTPSRQVISFTGRYPRSGTTYRNGSPLKMFILKRGLI